MAPARIPGPIGTKNEAEPVQTRSGAGAARVAIQHAGPILDVGHATSKQRAIHSSQASTESAEYKRFKASVLEQQIKNAKARGRSYYPPVSKDEMKPLGNGHRLRIEAADRCLAMLAALKKDKPASVIAEIASSYRDYKQDAILWNRYYDRKYYPKTKKARVDLKGGEHGAEARKYLARFVSKRKAAPGFSNHGDGVAVDFISRQGDERFGLDTDDPSRERYRTSWLYGWLVKNAAQFDFYQLNTEEWHWEYHVGTIPNNLIDRDR